MQQKNQPDNIFATMQSYIDKMSDLPFSGVETAKSVLDIQRRNINAFAEANKCVFDSWQRLAQKQLEMVGEAFQENGLKSRDSENVAQNGTDLSAGVSRSLLNTTEIISIMRDCTIQTTGVLSRNATEMLKVLKLPNADRD